MENIRNMILFSHGHNCRLISISKPVVGGVDTSEQLLAYFARVSSTSNQLNHATGPKLIKRLIKNGEWSPLEMVHAEIEIKTTRDIARQILRHTSLSPQEHSQRYAKASDELILRECRMQHPTNRQSSLACDDLELTEWWYNTQRELWNNTISKYTEALSRGIAKECARAILPEGNTSTLCYFSGSMRSWYHYTQLRTQESTQKEHRLIAKDCWDIIIEQIPSLARDEP